MPQNLNDLIFELVKAEYHEEQQPSGRAKRHPRKKGPGRSYCSLRTYAKQLRKRIRRRRRERHDPLQELI